MLIAEKNELRSKEMQQMLSQIPIWTTRLVTLVVLLVILMFGLISWVVRYPVDISQRIAITKSSSMKMDRKYTGAIMLKGGNYQKIEVGQDVTITLDNYPETEFGVLHGEISRISEISNKENELLVEVLLNNGIKTSRGKQIVFDEKIMGTALITTYKRRLIEVLFINLGF